MTTPLLYDAPGPRARRRVLVASLVGLAVLLLLLLVAGQRLADNGQFAYELYEPFFTEPLVYERLADGLSNTLTAAAYALVLASLLGVLLAFGRLSHRAWVRLPATVVRSSWPKVQAALKAIVACPRSNSTAACARNGGFARWPFAFAAAA